MVTAILFAANSAKAVVTVEYDGTTYICDMNIEDDIIYIENCTGVIGDVDVVGESGGGGDDVGGWEDIPVPDHTQSTGGGGGSSTSNSGTSIVDFRNLTHRQRIETLLNSLKNNRCIISELFSFFPTVSYTSPPEGTNITMCGENYTVVLVVGSFNDNFANYGAITVNSFENPYGCWEPINIGNNAVMRIMVKCGNLDSFFNCVFNRPF